VVEGMVLSKADLGYLPWRMENRGDMLSLATGTVRQGVGG
jgi:hypothetical protein